MKKKLYLGNNEYLSFKYSEKTKRYKIMLEFYDEMGKLQEE